MSESKVVLPPINKRETNSRSKNRNTSKPKRTETSTPDSKSSARLSSSSTSEQRGGGKSRLRPSSSSRNQPIPHPSELEPIQVLPIAPDDVQPDIQPSTTLSPEWFTQYQDGPTTVSFDDEQLLDEVCTSTPVIDESSSMDVVAPSALSTSQHTLSWSAVDMPLSILPACVVETTSEPSTTATPSSLVLRMHGNVASLSVADSEAGVSEVDVVGINHAQPNKNTRTNSRSLWDAYNEQWANQPHMHLMWERSRQWRAHQERAGHVEEDVQHQHQQPPSMWRASLRGGRDALEAVGNEFSGLYCATGFTRPHTTVTGSVVDHTHATHTPHVKVYGGSLQAYIAGADLNMLLPSVLADESSVAEEKESDIVDPHAHKESRVQASVSNTRVHIHALRTGSVSESVCVTNTGAATISIALQGPAKSVLTGSLSSTLLLPGQTATVTLATVHPCSTAATTETWRVVCAPELPQPIALHVSVTLQRLHGVGKASRMDLSHTACAVAKFSHDVEQLKLTKHRVPVEGDFDTRVYFARVNQDQRVFYSHTNFQQWCDLAQQTQDLYPLSLRNHKSWHLNVDSLRTLIVQLPDIHYLIRNTLLERWHALLVDAQKMPSPDATAQQALKMLILSVTRQIPRLAATVALALPFPALPTKKKWGRPDAAELALVESVLSEQDRLRVQRSALLNTLVRERISVALKVFTENAMNGSFHTLIRSLEMAEEMSVCSAGSLVMMGDGVSKAPCPPDVETPTQRRTRLTSRRNVGPQQRAAQQALMKELAKDPLHPTGVQHLALGSMHAMAYTPDRKYVTWALTEPSLSGDGRSRSRANHRLKKSEEDSPRSTTRPNSAFKQDINDVLRAHTEVAALEGIEARQIVAGREGTSWIVTAEGGLLRWPPPAPLEPILSVLTALDVSVPIHTQLVALQHLQQLSADMQHSTLGQVRVAFQKTMAALITKKEPIKSKTIQPKLRSSRSKGTRARASSSVAQSAVCPNKQALVLKIVSLRLKEKAAVSAVRQFVAAHLAGFSSSYQSPLNPVASLIKPNTNTNTSIPSNSSSGSTQPTTLKALVAAANQTPVRPVCGSTLVQMAMWGLHSAKKVISASANTPLSAAFRFPNPHAPLGSLTLTEPLLRTTFGLEHVRVRWMCVNQDPAPEWQTVFAVSEEGVLYSWGGNGENKVNMLGSSYCRPRVTPQPVQGFLDAKMSVVKVAAGLRHAVALTSTGGVYSWGSSEHGALGVGDRKPRQVPTLVSTVSAPGLPTELFEKKSPQAKALVAKAKRTRTLSAHKTPKSPSIPRTPPVSVAVSVVDAEERHSSHAAGLFKLAQSLHDVAHTHDLVPSPHSSVFANNTHRPRALLALSKRLLGVEMTGLMQFVSSLVSTELSPAQEASLAVLLQDVDVPLTALQTLRAAMIAVMVRDQPQQLTRLWCRVRDLGHAHDSRLAALHEREVRGLSQRKRTTLATAIALQLVRAYLVPLTTPPCTHVAVNSQRRPTPLSGSPPPVSHFAGYRRFVDRLKARYDGQDDGTVRRRITEQLHRGIMFRMLKQHTRNGIQRLTQLTSPTQQGESSSSSSTSHVLSFAPFKLASLFAEMESFPKPKQPLRSARKSAPRRFGVVFRDKDVSDVSMSTLCNVGAVFHSMTSTHTLPPRNTPVPSFDRITDIDCGASSSVAVTRLGFVFTWGEGREGTLGHGDNKDHDIPTRVEGLCAALSGTDVKHKPKRVINTNASPLRSLKLGLSNNTDTAPRVAVKMVRCGAKHMIALAANGDVYSWGKNNHNQLGLAAPNGPEDSFVPVLIPTLRAELTSAHPLFITAGSHSSAVVYRPPKMPASLQGL